MRSTALKTYKSGVVREGKPKGKIKKRRLIGEGGKGLREENYERQK